MWAGPLGGAGCISRFRAIGLVSFALDKGIVSQAANSTSLFGREVVRGDGSLDCQEKLSSYPNPSPHQEGEQRWARVGSPAVMVYLFICN